MLTEFDNPLFLNPLSFVEQEYRENTCLPTERDIFAALIIVT